MGTTTTRRTGDPNIRTVTPIPELAQDERVLDLNASLVACLGPTPTPEVAVTWPGLLGANHER